MEQAFADLATWIRDAGALGYLVAPLVMAAVAIFPIPAEIPAMLNGVLFGPWVGSVITWSGAMLGAWISFELSEHMVAGSPAGSSEPMPSSVWIRRRRRWAGRV